MTLLHPDFTIDKEAQGEDFSKNWNGQADPITYDVTINNTGDAVLNLVGAEDSLVDLSGVDLTDCDVLGINESCSFTYVYTPTVAEGEGNSLTNVVTATFQVDTAQYGLTNQLEESASETVTLLHPDYTVDKSCVTNPVTPGTDAIFNVVFNNAGDVDLIVSADEALEDSEGAIIAAGQTFELAVGETRTFTVTVPVPLDAGPEVSNSIETTATLPAYTGLPNVLNESAEDTCQVQGKIIVEKITDPSDSQTEFDFDGPGEFDPTLGHSETAELFVDPGTYIVTETVPDGWDLVDISCSDGDSSGDAPPIIGPGGIGTASYQVAAGETVTCTFTNRQWGEIIVKKITDPSDSQETFDFDGPGAFDPTLGHNETDSLSVRPGQYAVTETVPPGWDLVSIDCDDANSTQDDTNLYGPGEDGIATYNVEPGESVQCTFENRQWATKTGQKFEDLDADGPSAEDPGIPGVTIGVFETDATFVMSTTTDASGYYTFSLRPGVDYLVCEFPPESTPPWNQSYPTSETAGWGDCSVVDGAAADGWAINLTPGELDEGNDFGNYKNATKTGLKFDDRFADGVYSDTIDSGVEGVVIKAFPDSGGDPITTTTNATGHYTLTLTPGDYTVCEFPPDDSWTQSFPISTTVGATDACSAYTDAATWGWDISLQSGEVETDNNFGNFQMASKSGYKWLDTSQDGVWDGDEDVISSWEIHLLDVQGAVVSTTTTSAEGKYEFSPLMPGVTYYVCEVFPEMGGWSQTFPFSTDRVDQTDACGVEFGYPAVYGYEITLQSGEDHENNNFGNFQGVGCAYTQGYWKTHSADGPADRDDTWDLVGPLGEYTLFFDSGQTWIDVLWTPPSGGNAYYILAHQYIAAKLNVLAGASSTSISSELALAEALFEEYTPEEIGDRDVDPDLRAQFIELAETLDEFNNGNLGVPHCDDVDDNGS